MKIITDLNKGDGIIQFDGKLFQDYTLTLRGEGKRVTMVATCKRCQKDVMEIDFYYHSMEVISQLLNNINNHSCNIAFGVE